MTTTRLPKPPGKSRDVSAGKIVPHVWKPLKIRDEAHLADAFLFGHDQPQEGPPHHASAPPSACRASQVHGRVSQPALGHHIATVGWRRPCGNASAPPEAFQ